MCNKRYRGFRRFISCTFEKIVKKKKKNTAISFTCYYCSYKVLLCQSNIKRKKQQNYSILNNI